jgi:hypothetical protein
MGQVRIENKILFGKLYGRDKLEELGVDGLIILE